MNGHALKNLRFKAIGRDEDVTEGGALRDLRRIALLLAAAATACALGACGRAGPLEPPSGPTASATPTPGGDDISQTMRPPKVQPIQPPNQSFILDPLL